MDKSQPWYREPWPWLLLVPIVASMIVGFSMLGVAIRTSDGLVSDDIIGKGFSITRSEPATQPQRHSA